MLGVLHFSDQILQLCRNDDHLTTLNPGFRSSQFLVTLLKTAGRSAFGWTSASEGSSCFENMEVCKNDFVFWWNFLGKTDFDSKGNSFVLARLQFEFWVLCESLTILKVFQMMTSLHSRGCSRIVSAKFGGFWTPLQHWSEFGWHVSLFQLFIMMIMMMITPVWQRGVLVWGGGGAVAWPPAIIIFYHHYYNNYYY